MQRLISICYFILCYVTTVYPQQDGVIDDVGDIAFIAWSASNQDGFAFVFLDDCPNNTSIKFVDEEWTGSGFYTSSGEGENTWTNNTGSDITKGTVVIIQNADNNPTCNVGSVAETDAGFDLASSAPDQIFAFVGTRSSPTFLAMIGHTSLPNNGSGSVQTLSGTGLTTGSSAIHLTKEALYDGSTSCNSNVTSCLQMIYDDTAWSTLSSSAQFPSHVDTLFDGSVLPVELLSFSAMTTGNGVELHWSTAQETHNKGFYIQRKTTLTDWQTIDFLPGMGTTAETTEYEYTDVHIVPEVCFYRLIQVDYDGTEMYSHVVKTLLEQPDKLLIYHSIRNNILTISNTRNDTINIEIRNHLGQLVSSTQNATETATFNLKGLPSTLLYVWIRSSTEVTLLKLIYLPDG